MVADLRIKCQFEYEKMLSRGKRFVFSCNEYDEYCFEIGGQELKNRMLIYSRILPDQNEVVSSAQLFFEKALDYNRLLLHAVAVVVDGDAYLFFAPPSGGKTTMANYWKELLGERVMILADDSPVIGVEQQETYLWNSCWSKNTDEVLPQRYRIKGIGFICKNQEGGVTLIPSEQGIKEIIAGYPNGRVTKNKVEIILESTIRSISCWKCYCDGTVESAKTIMKTMIG